MQTTHWHIMESASPWSKPARAVASRTHSELAHDIEQLQLQRLATAVLSKSTEDLVALAESNPELIWEWQANFRQQRLEAEAASRFWSAALAALATIPSEAEVAVEAAE